MISDNTPVNAANTNAALASKTADNTLAGKQDLANTDLASGANTPNIQRIINSLASALGMTTSEVYNFLFTWSASYVGTATDTVKQRVDALTALFAGAGLGHNHNNVNGQGSSISALDLTNINKFTSALQSLDVTGANGLTYVVTTEFSGKTPGGTSTQAGILTTAPSNRVELIDAANSTNVEDGSGHKVYARLTESAGVWTLTFFVNIAGVETAYNLPSTNLKILYKEVFSIANAPTIPANSFEFGTVDLTADVVDASLTQSGKVNTSAQSFGGEKDFQGLRVNEELFLEYVDDSATTGANATLPNPSNPVIRVTNASLTSIQMIDSVQAWKMFILVNETGDEISIRNLLGGTPSKQIITGTAADLPLADKASLFIVYDNGAGKWRVIGGSGSGGGVITDTITNILALPRIEGKIYYATDKDQLLKDDGVEVTYVPRYEGDRDYLPLGNARLINPFTLYADGAATPVDGAGGSPTATLAITAEKFRYTSGALGDGAAYPFTIDSYDKATMRTLVLSSEHVSGAYAEGDLTVWLYDVTNSTLIAAQPTNKVQNFTGKQEFIFQLGAGSSYKFLVHQSTGATFVRDFRVTLKEMKFSGYAPIETDLKNYTPTFSGTTASSVDIKYARRGENLLLIGKFDHNGGGPITFTLPSGLIIDDTKISSTNYHTVGIGSISAAFYALTILAQGGLQTLALGLIGTGSSGNNPFPAAWSSETVQFFGEVPIKGWTSETKIISEYDGRVVSAAYYVSANYTPGSSSPVNFDTKIIDSHNAVTTGVGTWKFTAPISGVYNVKTVMTLTGSTCNIYLRKNGADYATLFTADATIKGGTSDVYLNAGEYIDITQTTGTTISGTGLPYFTHISITLNSGSQQITAGEKIAASYFMSANYPVLANEALNFDTKIFDDHSCVTVGSGNTWKFTAPRTDYYRIDVTANNGGTTVNMFLYKNGSAYSYLTQGTTGNPLAAGSVVIKLNAGDYISINSSASITFVGSGVPYQSIVSIISGAW